jgi:hypothetical protein
LLEHEIKKEKEKMKINLDMVRLAKGFTLDDVSKQCNIPVNIIVEAEKNPGEAKISIVKKMLRLYSVPADIISW